MKRSTPPAETASTGIDLTLVAQRILKLAEISALEHLDALDRSQAVNLSEMVYGRESEKNPATNRN